MIKDKIIESGKVGLYKRLEYKILRALCVSTLLWSIMSLALLIFFIEGNVSWPVWVALGSSIASLLIISFRIFHTYTLSEIYIVNTVLSWYDHRADQAKHKLQYGLEFEETYSDKSSEPVDSLLPTWHKEEKQQKRFRALLFLSTIIAGTLVSLSPWTEAFSNAFALNQGNAGNERIVWLSENQVEVGQPYTLLAVIQDTSYTSNDLLLNSLKIKPLYKNDTLSYVIESVTQDLHFTWQNGDKILSSFHVEVVNTTGNLYKVVLTPPSYIEEQAVQWINPKNIEVFEGSTLRVEKHSSDDSSALSFNGLLRQFNEDFIVMESAPCYTTIDQDTLWSMVVEVLTDNEPTISMEWNYDTIARAYTAIGSFEDDFGISSVFRQVHFIQSGEIIDTKRYSVIHDKSVEGDFADYFRRKDLWRSGVNAIEISYGACDNNEVKGSQCAFSRKIILTVPNQDTWDDQKDEEIEEMETTANRLNSSQSTMNERLEDIRNERLTETSSSADNMEILDFLESLEKLSDQKNLLQEEIEAFMLMAEEFNDPVDTSVLNPLLEEAQEDSRREELMDKIREALEQQDEETLDNALEELSEMESKEEMSLEMLERMLSQLMKENALKNAIQELDQLSKEEDSLDLNDVNALAKQNDINEQFDDIKNSIQEGEDLLGEESQDIGDLSEEIDNDLQDLLNQMQQGSPSESSKSNAAQKMQQLSSMLSMAMKSAKQKQLEMDLATLQQLLENLVDLSLIEEDLFLSKPSSNVGVFTKERKVRSQTLWNKNFDGVKDTLMALASRSPTAQKPIIDGIVRIEKRQEQLAKSFERGSQTTWATQAQGVMMEVNEIALLLDEELQNIKMKLSGQMQGSQMCENPGGTGQGQSGKPSKEGGLQDIMSDQAAMGQQGNKEGEGEDGNKGSAGKGGGGDKEDEALAALIKEQAKIRNALENWLKANNLEKEGSGVLDQMKRQEQMLSEGLLMGNEVYSEGRLIIELQLLKLEQAANKQGQKETRKSSSPVDQNVVIVPEEVQQVIDQIIQRRKRPTKVNPGLVAFYDKLWRSFTQ